MSLDLVNMDRAELRRTLRALAGGFAQADYARRHPSASEDEAWAWSDRNWHLFKEDALDLAALLAAQLESSLAALARVN